MSDKINHSEHSLIPFERGKVATPSVRVISGLEGIPKHSLQVQVPEVRIVTRVVDPDDPAKPGQLRIGKSRVESQIRCAFVKAHQVRRYMEQVAGTTATLCASADGLAPLPRVRSPYSAECTTCPHAQWERIGTKTVPPSCSVGVALLGVTLEPSPQPFWFVTYRTSQQETIQFLVDLNRMSGISAIYDVEVVLATRLMRGQSYSWHVPMYTITGVISDRDTRDMLESIASSCSQVRYEPYVLDSPSVVPTGNGGNDDEVPF